jgi:hypothetical protein
MIDFSDFTQKFNSKLEVLICSGYNVLQVMVKKSAEYKANIDEF